MASSGRGYLLILNVQVNRPGSNVDKENLYKVFTKMGAYVHPVDDPTGKDVRKIMGEMKKIDFTNYLYVAVAYLSHGGEDDLVEASDSELIKAQKSILVPLCNIPSLDGKLKWLIMQTCRGSYDFLKLKPEGPVPLIKYPKYYAKFFATSQGMKAYRTTNGSFFIGELCKRLEGEYMDHDIISIMQRTTLDVEDKCKELTDFKYLQKPEAETNFDGKLFFVTSGFQDN